MVEEMLAARGICVTYETVRQWGKKFGKAFSDPLRQRAPQTLSSEGYRGSCKAPASIAPRPRRCGSPCFVSSHVTQMDQCVRLPRLTTLTYHSTLRGP